MSAKTYTPDEELARVIAWLTGWKAGEILAAASTKVLYSINYREEILRAWKDKAAKGELKREDLQQ